MLWPRVEVRAEFHQDGVATNMFPWISVARSRSRRFSDYIVPNLLFIASMTDVDQCERDREACLMQNVSAVSLIVDACERSRSHLAHLSTDFIFDGKDGPYGEEDAPNPLNYYGQTKLISEQILQGSSIEWTIVRTALVYGITNAMTKSNIVLWVKSALERGKELSLVDDQVRTPTLAEDLAAGCVTIVGKKALGIYNISGRENLTPYQMGVQVAEYFGLDLSKIKKAIKHLNYSPRNFKEGIEVMDSQMRSETFCV